MGNGGAQLLTFERQRGGALPIAGRGFFTCLSPWGALPRSLHRRVDHAQHYDSWNIPTTAAPCPLA
jgi:hypothetical protein